MIRWILDQFNQISGERPGTAPEVREALGNTFRTPEGRRALTYILTDFGFFDRMVDPETGEMLTGEARMRAEERRDCASRILELMGVLHEGNVEALTTEMTKLPVWEPKTRGGH